MPVHLELCSLLIWRPKKLLLLLSTAIAVLPGTAQVVDGVTKNVLKFKMQSGLSLMEYLYDRTLTRHVVMAAEPVSIFAPEQP